MAQLDSIIGRMTWSHSRQYSLDEHLHQIHNVICTETGADAVWLAAVNPATGQVRGMVGSSNSKDLQTIRVGDKTGSQSTWEAAYPDVSPHHAMVCRRGAKTYALVHIQSTVVLDQTTLQALEQAIGAGLGSAWALVCYRATGEISRAINADLSNARDLFAKLHQYLGNYIDMSGGLLLAEYDHETKELRYTALVDAEITSSTTSELHGGCGYVLDQYARSRTERGAELYIRDYPRERDGLPTRILDMDNQEVSNPSSLLFIPLLLRELPVGVLSVQSFNPNAYDEVDLDVVRQVGNQVSLALGNMRLFRYGRVQATLGRILVQELDKSRVPTSVVEAIREATRADVCVLYLYDNDAETFELPPVFDGKLLNTDFSQQTAVSEDDVISLAVKHAAPEYVAKSSELYEILGGHANRRRGNFESREKILSVAIIPVKGPDGIVGVLVLNYRKEQIFDAPQKQFAESLAAYAGVAIRNSIAFQAAAASEEWLLKVHAAVQRSTNAILQRKSTRHALSLVLDEAVRLTNAKAGLVVTISPSEIAGPQYSIGLSDASMAALLKRLEQFVGIDRNVHKRSFHGSAAIEHLLEPTLLTETGTKSALAARLSLRESAQMAWVELIMVLCGDSDTRFGPTHQQAILTLTDIAGVSLADLERTQAVARLGVLRRVSNQLAAIDSPEDVHNAYEVVMREVREHFDSQIAIRRYRPGADTLKLEAKIRKWESDPVDVVRIGEGNSGRAALTLQPELVDDVDRFSQRLLHTDHHAKTLLAVPIKTGLYLFGTLSLAHETPGHFRDTDIDLLIGLADQLAQTIARLEMEKMRREEMAIVHVVELSYEIAHSFSNHWQSVGTESISRLRNILEGYLASGALEMEALNNLQAMHLDLVEKAARLYDQLKSVRNVIAGQRQFVWASEVFSIARRLAADHGAILLSPVEEPSAQVYVVKSDLREIVEELMQNACQASTQDSPTVQLEDERGRDSIRFRLTDFGSGIADEFRMRIFDLWFSTKEGDGAIRGFGLWHARRLALQNGWGLTLLRTELGKGSTFEVVVPTVVMAESRM